MGPALATRITRGGYNYDDSAYYRARYYDPAIGRFISEDPVRFTGGINFYPYTGNNPISRIDPFGLTWFYSQSTGVVVHVDDSTGSFTYPGSGYSGNGSGLNNPDMENVQNTGPIPQGSWTIGPEQLNVTSTGTKLPDSMRLTPDDDTETYGRNGFLIHGDNSSNNNSASSGCIILNHNIRNQIGSSGDNRLVVEQ